VTPLPPFFSFGKRSVVAGGPSSVAFSALLWYSAASNVGSFAHSIMPIERKGKKSGAGYHSFFCSVCSWSSATPRSADELQSSALLTPIWTDCPYHAFSACFCCILASSEGQ
jgi:hypothetical protein